MKKHILFLLCLLLLCAATPAYAAGGADDPLISLSYVTDTFLPRLTASLRSIREQAVSTFAAAHADAPARGTKTLSLRDGDQLFLRSGQQLTLLSGSIRLQLQSGALINATAGRSSVGGDAQRGNRYLLCGNSQVTATVSGSAVVCVSVGVTGNISSPSSGECPFTDVPENAWYRTNVVQAYTRGLVNGISADKYAPTDTLSAAQTVKLAACMHQLYRTGSVTLKNASDGRAWYMSYVDYAKQNGLMDADFPDYNAAITRGDFIRLFFNALPESEYTGINLIMDGSVPDVATDAPLAKQVYTFYTAGILTGYSAGSGYLEHAFGPQTTITRAEAATVMNRMFDPSARKSFTMD